MISSTPWINKSLQILSYHQLLYRVMLFDIEKDPQERLDIADQHPQVVKVDHFSRMSCHWDAEVSAKSSLVLLSIRCFYEPMWIWLVDLLENWQLFIIFQDLLGRIDSIRSKMPPSPRYWMGSPNWTQVTRVERGKQVGHFLQTWAKKIHLEQKKAKELWF